MAPTGRKIKMMGSGSRASTWSKKKALEGGDVEESPRLSHLLLVCVCEGSDWKFRDRMKLEGN